MDSEDNTKKDQSSDQCNGSNNIVKKIINKNYKYMDSNNRAAAKILKTGDLKATINFMMTDQKTGRTLSYAEMRELYG